MPTVTLISLEDPLHYVQTNVFLLLYEKSEISTLRILVNSVDHNLGPVAWWCSQILYYRSLTRPSYVTIAFFSYNFFASHN